MIFKDTGLDGLKLVELEPSLDARGSFLRTFDAAEWEVRGLTATVAQCSLSCNRRRGTLRGLHYQEPPHEETKLVRCSRGRIFDVAVDLRASSPTFRRWFGTELSDRNGRMLYIPVGFAHGFLTLEPETEVSYQISTPYVPEAARGVRWDDPAFGIDWPDVPQVISDRDRSFPDFSW